MGLKHYIVQGHAPFPVYAVQSPAEAVKLGFGVTPETIVLGGGGKVQKVWAGAYMGDSQKQVEQYFGAKLPGLQEVTASPNQQQTH